jgi:hypothetical protein
LPGNAKFIVVNPAALSVFAAFTKLSPKVVNFFLRLAVHDKRCGWAEFKERAAVQAQELVAIQLKLHGHDRTLPLPGGFRSRLSVPSYPANLRAPAAPCENPHVEIRCFFCLFVKP